MRFLHIAGGAVEPRVYTEPFRQALARLGDLQVIEYGERLDEDTRAKLIRQFPVLLTSWGASPIPVEIAKDPGELRYVCNVTGELRRWVPLEIVESGIPVTNWGDTPAIGVAEGAMTLLLAVLKDLHAQIQQIRDGGWALDTATSGGSLHGLNVGIYGCGVIGRRFIELLRPFGAVMRVFDPYAENMPEGCIRAESMEALFRRSQAVVIHAGLSDETRHSVTAELLALLPDHGVVINTARGGIVDQDALFAELRNGRLRAGLDVLEPDTLPVEHEARTWPNLILTGHAVNRTWPTDGLPPTRLEPMHEVCIDNLQRFIEGKPLRFAYTRERYLRST